MKYLPFIFLCCFSVIASEKPNVILIVADDLGSKGLASFGGKYLETPNIDELCSGGMKFTNGLACYPTCKPSRAALLSGQYGPRTGIYRVSDNHKGLEDKIKYVVPENGVIAHEKLIIPEMFKLAGYKTAMFGKWHVSDNEKGHPLTHGFDEAIASAKSHYNFKTYPEVKYPNGSNSAEFFTEKANDFMDRSVKEQKPFFLYMPYYLVHRPLETKKEYIEHFKKKMFGKEEDEELPILAAMTKLLDDCVGRLVEKLNDLGIRDNTLIIFTSDNGSFKELYNGDLRGKKGDVYEGGMRVPYIFNWQGRITPSQSTERIVGLDIFPTLKDILGLSLSSQTLDGVSLLPLLERKVQKLSKRPILCFYPKYARFGKKSKEWVMSWRNVLYEGDYKLTYYPEYDKYDLFNLEKDHCENNNLHKSQPELLISLKKRMDELLESMKAPSLTVNKDFKLD